jgi:hypothetical protein
MNKSIGSGSPPFLTPMFPSAPNTVVGVPVKPTDAMASAQNISPVSVQPTSPNISYAQLKSSLKVNDTDRTATYLLSRYKQQIFAAAKRYGVAPEVIATILFDEMRRRSWEDDWQDSWVRNSLNKVANSDQAGGINTLLYVVGKNIASNVTLGLTQMSVQGVINLSRNGYLQQIISRNDFETAPELNSQKLLMNEKMAPFLVAAWCAYVMDSQSGMKSSSGFTYSSFRLSDNPDLHFVFLTGTYSQGGAFRIPNSAGNTLDIKSNSDPEIIDNPPNQRAADALKWREWVNWHLNNT